MFTVLYGIQIRQKISEETLGTNFQYIDNKIHANFFPPDDDPVLYELANQY